MELISIQRAPVQPYNLKTPPADALHTESGIVIQTLKPGFEDIKVAGAAAIISHFTLWDEDGKMYQSTRTNNKPAPMSLETAPIVGLREALPLLHLGQSARIWIPAELAFKGQQGAPQGTLIFDLEVMRIFNAPPHLDAAPEDAIKTASGLAYKVLKSTDDPEAKSPMASSKVTMHYIGWNEEGKLFDSSYFAGPPGTFILSAVMPGWTEGVQLMKTGDHFRFWIPEALGLGSRPGAPKGDVVFDIELISIQ